METLITDAFKRTEPQLNYFITYLNLLEGYKTRVKNLHWSANGFNIHKNLDELLDIISEFQDSVAEESMGIYGQMKVSDITGTLCSIYDPIRLIKDIKAKTERFYKGLNDNISYIGIRSETETFVHNLNKYIYLFSLCKG